MQNGVKIDINTVFVSILNIVRSFKLVPETVTFAQQFSPSFVFWCKIFPEAVARARFSHRGWSSRGR